MDRKVEPLWDVNSDPPAKLRLPNTPTSRLMQDVTSPVSPPDNTKKPSTSSKQPTSILSVNAPEFFPSSYYQNQSNNTAQKPHASAIQNRLKKHKAPEPNSTQQNRNSDDHSDGDNVDYFVDTPDDIRLKHLIDTLTKDPGQFNDLLDIFMDTLCPYFDDVLVLSRAAQLLVEQGMHNSNFQYSGARLCGYIELHCPKFRAALHLTCQKEMQLQSNMSGLLLFMAELYTQLHHENVYGNNLIEACNKLLTIGGNDNIKCVCQALKLTGYSLDLNNKEALNKVFEKLKELKASAAGTASSLIDSVINLRNVNWGHASSPTVSSSSEPEAPYWGDAPPTVFYHTDGSQLTSEENDFLAAHISTTDEYLTDTSDPDDLCDPEPEMDEEIQRAFKDFVKASKR